MKKLLALVLALVMSMSLVTISNAAYSDAADVDYKEAVDVMSAVGVFQGADGKFSPKAELTREQAAKLIAYLDLGEKTAEALPAVKVFNDVEANRWSAKYVAYCADAGYLAGVGDNNFDPAGKLTGYAFGKMLLCVLGYDAAIEGFTGANWQIAVAKLMQSNDIAKSVDASASATLTREAAAQYCLNTLKADMVEYASKGTNVTINGAVIATGASKAEAVTAKYDTKYNSIDNTNTTDTTPKSIIQLGEKLYDGKLVLTAPGDDFGRTADKWTYKTKEVGTYGSETPVLTYTAKVKGGDLYTDLGKPTKANGDQATFTLVVDGVTATIDEAATLGVASTTDLEIASGNKGTIGGNGIAVEVYETSTTGVYKIVVVNTYVGYIKNWTAAVTDKNGDITTKEFVTVDDKANTMTFTANGDNFNTTAFTKQDKTDGTVVLYTAKRTAVGTATYTVKSVVAADKVENVKITSVNGTKFTAGETYSQSANAYYGTAVGYKNTVDVYTDAYGYAIYVKLYEAASKDYAVLLDTASKDDTFGGNTVYYAKLLMLDGTTKEVQIDKDNTVGKTAANEGSFVTYTVEDDVYTLALAGSFDANTTEANTVDVNKGAVALTLNDSKSANNNTLYIVAKTEDGKTVYNTYTGYKAVAGVSGNLKFAYVMDSADKFVEYVYVDATTGATFDNDTSKLTYAFIVGSLSSTASTNADGTYYTVNAVVDGEVKTLKVNATVEDVLDDATKAVYTATAATFNSKGVITGLTGGAWLNATNTVGAEYADGVITIGGTDFQIADDVKVFAVDTDDDYAVTESTIADVEENDVVYYVLEDDTTVADYQHLIVAIYNFAH